MQLEAFSVCGIRCLGSADEIPTGKPTVLTGVNDGGKTAAIFSLGFLLGGPAPTADDRTWARDTDEPPGGVDDTGRFAEACVVGRFSLSSSDQQELGLPSEVLLRRRCGSGTRTLYEVRMTVPADERLRDLTSDLRLDDLRARAVALGIEAEGAANAKASFLTPLRRLADASSKTEDWVPAPAGLVERLPRLLSFSSSREPNPEAEIATALRGEYTRIVEDPDLVGVLSDIERDVRQRLQEEADDLKGHIRNRVPELADIDIVPSVSFTGGFQGADLVTSTGAGERVPLHAVGSGRRRRMTLAIWEWTSGVVAREESPRPTVIAYDEPDTHLDYARQRDLVDVIRAQAAIPHVRVLLATHSLNLIDKVDIRDVIHLVLEDGRTSVRRLPGTGHEEIDRHLAEVATAMGMRNSVLLHERCFLGVEGSTETQALPALFRLVTGYSLQAAGIALVPGNNNTGALEFARFLNSQGRRVAFMVDADSARAAGSRKLFRLDRLRRYGLQDEQVHMIGNPGEIEDLFTDNQWRQTANRHWRRNDGRLWLDADFAALRTGDGFAKRLVDLIRTESQDAPGGKPGYLAALVTDLTSREEVPSQLDTALTAVFQMCN